MNKLPITVGIIGHLDSIITEEHKSIIDELFNDINKRYPNSPVTLFSQLAKGADTVVAEQFIAIKEKTKRDYNLTVPIPYKIEEYKEEQFKKDKSSLDTFEKLLGEAERHFVLENVDNLGKNDLYRKGGQFVADSSIILIAIWEEYDNKKTGGTADVVRYKRTGSFEEDIGGHIFDLNGTLISLPCNRESSSTNPDISLENNQLENLLKDESIKKSLDKIDDLNKKLTNINSDKLEKSADYLYLKDELLIEPNKRLKDYYSIIDVQAGEQKEKYETLIRFFFGIGAAFLLSFEIYKHFGLNLEFFILTIGLLILALIRYKYSHNRDNHRQFIENRVLAEALRVQLFWNVGDIKKSVSKHILRIHKTEYNWMTHILMSIYGLTYNAQNTRDDKTIEEIKTEWIEDQLEFYSGREKKGEKKAKDGRLKELAKEERQFRSWWKSLFVIAFITLVVIGRLAYIKYNNNLLHGLIVLDSVLFGASALIKAYYDKKGNKQIRNQYLLMSSIYKATIEKMDEIKASKLSKDEEDEKLDQLLYLVGKEALVEHGNWYIIFKEKEPEVEGG